METNKIANVEAKKKINLEELKKKLHESFDKMAYGSDNSRGFKLTTLDAYYVIERLNNVFGLCGIGWGLDVKEWILGKKELVVLAELWFMIDSEKHAVSCEGGKHIVTTKTGHTCVADAYKGARTNAICKGASFLGVGLDVYKGEYKGGNLPPTGTSPPNNPSPKQSGDGKITEKQIGAIYAIFDKNTVSRDNAKRAVSAFLYHDVDSMKTLTSNEASKVIDYIQDSVNVTNLLKNVFPDPEETKEPVPKNNNIPEEEPEFEDDLPF